MILIFFTDRRNIFFRWFGLFVVLLFIISFVFKTFYIPNQLLILLAGIFLFSLIFLPVFLFVSLKSLENRVSLGIHIIGLLSCSLLLWELFIWLCVPIIHAQFRIIPFSKIQIITIVSIGLWYGVVRDYEAISYPVSTDFFYEPQTLAYH